MKSNLETIYELVDRINNGECRVTMPFSEPSPVRVLFDGSFTNAVYMALYPSTLVVYGMNGQISVTDIQTVDKMSHDKYIIRFGRDPQIMDIMVQICE